MISTEAALGRNGRLLIGTPSLAVLFEAILALAALSIAGLHIVRSSRLGAGLLAIREDEVAAQAVGVNAAALKLLAFTASAFVPGMVGGLMILRTTYFEPMQAFSPTTSFTIVTIAILGGSDEVAGPVLGAVFLVLLSESLWTRAPEIYMIILGGLLITFVLFVPEGLFGRAQRLLGFGRTMTLLRLENVGKSYGGVVALRGLSFAISAGEIVGLMGANGAGKTTAFSLIACTQRLSVGKIWFDGKRIDGKPSYTAARLGIARTFQIVRPFAGLSVVDNLVVAALYGHARERSRAAAEARARDILAEVGLERDATQSAETLTLARRKRLEIARAVATGPRLLLLDEVLAGFDRDRNRRGPRCDQGAASSSQSHSRGYRACHAGADASVPADRRAPSWRKDRRGLAD